MWMSRGQSWVAVEGMWSGQEGEREREDVWKRLCREARMDKDGWRVIGIICRTKRK